MVFNRFTGNLNSRIISKLGFAPLNILLEIARTFLAFNFIFKSVWSQFARVLIKELADLIQYFKAMQEYFIYQAQLYNIICQ